MASKDTQAGAKPAAEKDDTARARPARDADTTKGDLAPAQAEADAEGRTNALATEAPDVALKDARLAGRRGDGTKIEPEDTPEGKATAGASLTDAEVVALRTGKEADDPTKPVTPTDHYEKVFVVQTRGLGDRSNDEEMHRANQVATLQEALSRGLHPTGEASFVHELEGKPGEWPGTGSTAFTYTCPVIPATRHDMGGTTLTGEDAEAIKAELARQEKAADEARR